MHFGVEAAAISKKIGGPVKLIYSREDDMTQGTYRPAYQSVYKAGLDENNNLIAFSVKGAGLPAAAEYFGDLECAHSFCDLRLHRCNLQEPEHPHS